MAFELPTHIGFIMDGNGRWATRQGKSRLEGHRAGVEALRRVIKELGVLEVPYASFFAFSTENWKRPEEEVRGLFELFEVLFGSELETLHKQNVRLKFIGDHSDSSPLSPMIRRIMAEATLKTAGNTGPMLIFAINYGGHDELARAAQKLQVAGTPITAQALEGALDTAGIPAPDLIIRTSGEQRLSGFLTWQSAYAELYFTEVAWPDFGATHLQAALAAYTKRQRRFGGLEETAPAHVEDMAPRKVAAA